MIRTPLRPLARILEARANGEGDGVIRDEIGQGGGNEANLSRALLMWRLAHFQRLADRHIKAQRIESPVDFVGGGHNHDQQRL